MTDEKEKIEVNKNFIIKIKYKDDSIVIDIDNCMIGYYPDFQNPKGVIILNLSEFEAVTFGHWYVHKKKLFLSILRDYLYYLFRKKVSIKDLVIIEPKTTCKDSEIGIFNFKFGNINVSKILLNRNKEDMCSS